MLNFIVFTAEKANIVFFARAQLKRLLRGAGVPIFALSAKGKI
jgi:hypothetical protein